MEDRCTKEQARVTALALALADEAHTTTAVSYSGQVSPDNPPEEGMQVWKTLLDSKIGKSKMVHI